VSDNDQNRWDKRYSADHYIFGEIPASFLVEKEGLLPNSGRALDIAAGEGQNSVYLAELGFEVEAVDISAVGLRKAKSLAKRRGVDIEVRLWDIERSLIPDGPFDVIICFNYLQRSLAPRIEETLAPGGILIMELATVENLKYHRHPSRRFLIANNELMTWHQKLSILSYDEGVYQGRHLAQLVGQKPRPSSEQTPAKED
jgi:tellurite methyltransferase